MTVTHRPILRSTAVHAACVLAAFLAGCTSTEGLLSGDKIDYRSASKTSKTNGLEVPPDLTQLSRDSRYQQSGGAVSASTFQSPATTQSAAAVPLAAITPETASGLRLARLGEERWLVTPLPPEQLWPQLEAFWRERGFALAVDQPDVGVMETEWAENRAKLPQDVIRRTLGGVIDSLYDTGERDKFRTRVERTPNGTEVYVTHRGMVEVYNTQLRDTTMWQPRPSDRQLEIEMLQRIMGHLGAKEEQVQASAAAIAAPQTPRARIVEGQPAATLAMDDGFDRAWRRVGLALDRSGFTVEDRDRANGVYFVRYIDPQLLGKGEPGFFGKLFSFGLGRKEAQAPSRYRVSVKAAGEGSTVSVHDAQGAPENGETGKRIVRLLLEDLK